MKKKYSIQFYTRRGHSIYSTHHKTPLSPRTISRTNGALLNSTGWQPRWSFIAPSSALSGGSRVIAIVPFSSPSEILISMPIIALTSLILRSVFTDPVILEGKQIQGARLDPTSSDCHLITESGSRDHHPSLFGNDISEQPQIANSSKRNLINWHKQDHKLQSVCYMAPNMICGVTFGLISETTRFCGGWVEIWTDEVLR